MFRLLKDLVPLCKTVWKQAFTPIGQQVIKTKRFVGSLAISFLKAVSDLSLLFFFREMVDSVGDSKVIWWPMVGFIAVWGLGRLLPQAQKYLVAAIRTHVPLAQTEEIVSHFFQMPHQDQLQVRHGTVFNHMVRVYAAFNLFVAEVLEKTISIGFEILLGTTLFTVLYSPWVGLSILGIVVMYSGVAVLLSKPVIDAEQDRARGGKRFREDVNEILSRFFIIEMTGMVKKELTDLDSFISDYKNKLQLTYEKSALAVSYGNLFLIFVFTLMMMTVAFRVGENFTVGDFVGVALYSVLFADRLSQFGEAIINSIGATVDNRALESFLAIKVKEEINLQQLSRLDVRLPPVISFIDVCANLSQDVNGMSLQHITIDIPPSKTTVIMGHNGAGKSSLFNLLLGRIKPTLGRIEINGKSLSELVPIAEGVAIVQQIPDLFQRSLRDNLIYGLPVSQKVTDDQMHFILRLLGLSGRFPSDQWDKRLGSQDLDLSGGEQQRVILGRAVLRILLGYASLLLLDEPTKSLDKSSIIIFNRVLAQLRQLEGGLTILLITHDSEEALLHGDYFVVLEKGRVVQQGIREEVLADEDGAFVRRMSSLDESEVVPDLPRLLWQPRQGPVVTPDEEISDAWSVSAHPAGLWDSLSHQDDLKGQQISLKPLLSVV